MNINIKFDETDLALALKSVIKHSNQKEMINFFSHMIGESNKASQWFFKLTLGNSLPEILPNGSLCKISVKDLTYGISLDKLLDSNLTDSDGYCVVKITEFRGFHAYSEYTVEFTNIDVSDIRSKSTASVSFDKLILIEDI